ncbi:MAG TPA: HD domain-containing phosphohydrolase [Dissulfurispiraceae bacterium]|nr:HD domain-containing phosphohydrolase [Dissulfurispiraceae bacterium]
MRTYVVEEEEHFVPITLDKLVEGHAVPFEVFTDDGDLRKSLFDRGFIFTAFAKDIIHYQGLTRFYIKSANNLNFNDYLRHADKLSKMVKDENILFSDYSEYKRKHNYIDKRLFSPLVDINFEIGGMRYPVYGGIPLVGNHINDEMLNFLTGLNADIVIRGEDTGKYEDYLNRVLVAEEGECTEKRLIQIKQELLRHHFSKFLMNRTDVFVFEGLLQEVFDIVQLIIQFAQHPVFGLKDLIEIHNIDSYVSVHSVNVCVYSVAIGARLGMDEKTLYRLGVGALLHDIGKVMISYAVINKQGDLSIDEYKHYCSHVTEGAEFIKSLKRVPQNVYEIVMQHHERLDGSGYVQNLTSKEINLLSQIVTVTDSFEALTTSTPRRKALSPAKAMEILRADAEEKHRINRTVYRALNSVLSE